MKTCSIGTVVFTLPLMALLAGTALPATSQPRDPAAIVPAPAPTRIEIQPTALEPERTRADATRGFELANRSTALARVEFRLRRGDGLTCVTEGEAPVKARKFVVPSGATLACRAADDRTGRLDYEVYRNVRLASGAHRKEQSSGRIELR